eukprot:jgi/Mesvir1/16643/Mv10178-RA.1
MSLRTLHSKAGLISIMLLLSSLGSSLPGARSATGGVEVAGPDGSARSLWQWGSHNADIFLPAPSGTVVDVKAAGSGSLFLRHASQWRAEAVAFEIRGLQASLTFHAQSAGSAPGTLVDLTNEASLTSHAVAMLSDGWVRIQVPLVDTNTPLGELVWHNGAGASVVEFSLRAFRLVSSTVLASATQWQLLSARGDWAGWSVDEWDEVAEYHLLPGPSGILAAGWDSWQWLSTLDTRASLGASQGNYLRSNVTPGGGLFLRRALPWSAATIQLTVRGTPAGLTLAPDVDTPPWTTLRIDNPEASSASAEIDVSAVKLVNATLVTRAAMPLEPWHAGHVAMAVSGPLTGVTVTARGGANAGDGSAVTSGYGRTELSSVTKKVSGLGPAFVFLAAPLLPQVTPAWTTLDVAEGWALSTFSAQGDAAAAGFSGGPSLRVTLADPTVTSATNGTDGDGGGTTGGWMLTSARRWSARGVSFLARVTLGDPAALSRVVFTASPDEQGQEDAEGVCAGMARPSQVALGALLGPPRADGWIQVTIPLQLASVGGWDDDVSNATCLRKLTWVLPGDSPSSSSSLNSSSSGGRGGGGGSGEGWWQVYEAARVEFYLRDVTLHDAEYVPLGDDSITLPEVKEGAAQPTGTGSAQFVVTGASSNATGTGAGELTSALDAWGGFLFVADQPFLADALRFDTLGPITGVSLSVMGTAGAAGGVRLDLATFTRGLPTAAWSPVRIPLAVFEPGPWTTLTFQNGRLAAGIRIRSIALESHVRSGPVNTTRFLFPYGARVAAASTASASGSSTNVTSGSGTAAGSGVVAPYTHPCMCPPVEAWVQGMAAGASGEGDVPELIHVRVVVHQGDPFDREATYACPAGGAAGSSGAPCVYTLANVTMADTLGVVQAIVSV